MSDPYVLVRDDGKDSPAHLGPGTFADVAFIFIVTGLVLAVAGTIDLGMILLPSHAGDTEWRTPAVSRTLDALWLPTLGLALVAVGLRARGGRRAWMRLVALVFGVLGLALIALLARLAPGIADALRVKAAILGIAYPAAWLAMAIFLWRSTRRQKNRVIMEE